MSGPFVGDACGGVSEVTRPDTGGLPWESAFTTIWPDLARQLGSALRARGVPASAVDDTVQEVALRAWRVRPGFTDADDLMRWCRTVARRLLIDEHRKARRLLDVVEVPDERGELVEPTAALEAEELHAALARAIGALPAAQRAALAHHGSRAEASTAYVRRHRARAKLLAAVEGFLGLLAWLQHQWHQASHRGEAVLAAGTTLGTIAFVGVAVFAHRPASPGEQLPIPPVPGRAVVAGRLPAGTTVARTPVARAEPAASAGRSRTRAEVSRPTPIGRPFIVRVYDDEPQPLTCLDLPTVGLRRCVDYPLRP